MDWVVVAEIVCLGCVYLACGLWGWCLAEDWLR